MKFKNIDEIDEFSIGHSIISRAVLIGMRAAVADMRKLVSAL
jgi:pyridoxine 5-phosphate synthase